MNSWKVKILAATLVLSGCQATTVKKTSPFIADTLSSEEHAQVRAIAELLSGETQSDGITAGGASALTKALTTLGDGQAINSKTPINRKQLQLLEENLWRQEVFAWPKAKTASKYVTSYNLDPKAISLRSDGRKNFCGPDHGVNYKEVNTANGLVTYGNEGIQALLYPTGDFNGDSVDDFLIPTFRQKFSEQLNKQNKSHFMVTPTLMISNPKADYGLFESSFTDVTDTIGLQDALWTRHVGNGDLDGDGFDDLVIADMGTDYRPECGLTNKIYRNEGGKRYSLVNLDLPFNDYSHGFAMTDFDGDGDLDMAFINSPYANEKTKAKCQAAYGRPTINHSYFLVNEGNMKFKTIDFNKTNSRLFYSGAGKYVSEEQQAYMILGEVGKKHNWRKGGARIDVTTVSKSFRLKHSHYIEPPAEIADTLMAMAYEFIDLDNNGTEEMVISWQFDTPMYEKADYISSSGTTMGGQYLQVIENPLSKDYIDVTRKRIGHPQPLNVKGTGSWCDRLYGADVDMDGDTDLLCSSFGQWERVVDQNVPIEEPVPVFYRNRSGVLTGEFFSNNQMNKNKWLVPMKTRSGLRVAQLEGSTCQELLFQSYTIKAE